MTIITTEMPACRLVSAIRECLPFLSAEGGPWVAGGSIRRIYEGDGLSFSDVDVFFPNHDLFTWAVNLFDAQLKDKKVWSPVHIVERRHAPMSATFDVLYEGIKLPIQFVNKRYYKTLEAVLDDFDFTLTMFGYDGEKMMYDERAPIDLAAKRLVLHQLPKRPKPNRLAKYVAQGFVPAPGVLAHMLGAHIKADWFQPNQGLVYDYVDNY